MDPRQTQPDRLGPNPQRDTELGEDFLEEYLAALDEQVLADPVQEGDASPAQAPVAGDARATDQGEYEGGGPEGERFTATYEAIIGRAAEHQVQPSLDRIATLMDYLGNPQSAYPAIHITGTNGKTSTARMVDALTGALGLRSGRFTSPHLVSATERIAIAGRPISESAFVRIAEDINPIVELVETQAGVKFSFFEYFTAMALAGFAQAPIDLGVIEVGMGGTWDATNVVPAAVSVITPISLDHQKWLGATLADIAREKAGIIKPGATVICAEQDEEVTAIIAAACRAQGALLRQAGVDFRVDKRTPAVGGQLLTITTPAATYSDIFLPLFGAHQAANAALALAAMEAISGGQALDGAVVEAAFAAVQSPGRLQLVRKSPTIFVDAAHNPGGAAALRTALEEDLQFSHLVGVYAAMADKNIEATLAELEPIFDSLVVTTFASTRAASVEELEPIAVDVFGADRVIVAPDLIDALDAAAAASEQNDDPLTQSAVIACGSVAFVGEVCARLVQDHPTVK